MPISILMPALSPTMEKGNLTKWLVAEGDAVAPGDVIAEIETDKATMEVEAVDEGTMGRILVAEGTEDVAVNEPIAMLLEEGEEEADLSDASPPEPDKQKESKKAETGDDASGEGAPKKEKTAETAPQSRSEKPAPAKGNGSRIFASPLARRIAGAEKLDLKRISGSGPHGRIVKRDVEEALEKGGAGMAEPAAGGKPPATTGATDVAKIERPDMAAYFEQGSYDAIPLDGMRAAIARRLTQSKRDIPHYYLSIDCALDELLSLRKKLNARSDQYKISVNDFIIRASALALKAVPEANATWAETHILRHHHADISLAVAIDGGLITPIIRKADTKGLAEIAIEARDLAERARNRKLAPHEYEGGTFSVSNLGMFAIRNFTAVINPPQAAIMAVGAGEQRAVVRDGEVQTATLMTVTLSCDHRVIDGALGARLLAAFKGYVEEPLTMLL